MDTIKKNQGQTNPPDQSGPAQPSRDPDFDIQEAPDYGELASPAETREAFQKSNPSSLPPIPKKPVEDRETLDIQKPIESLFSKDHLAASPDEEIELPHKQWSKKQEKKMKKKLREQPRFLSGQEHTPPKPEFRPSPTTTPYASPNPSPHSTVSSSPSQMANPSRAQSREENPPPKTEKLNREIPPPPLVKQENWKKQSPQEDPSFQPRVAAVVNPPPRQVGDKAERTTATPEKTSPHLTAHPAHSKGIAYVDQKNRIKISGGYKVYSGDVFKVGEQEFVVKEAKRSWTNYYIGGAITLVMFLLILKALWPQDTVSRGNLTGIVVEQNSRALVPQASIRIKELGLKVESNELGFFNFQIIPPGTYTVEASFPGFGDVAEQATVTSQKTSNLALLVSPFTGSTAQTETPAVTPKLTPKITPKLTPTQKQTAPVEVAPTSRGTLSLKTNPPDALVMINNKQAGNGNVTSDLKPGTYTVKVTKSGYKDWQKKITLKPGQNTSWQVDLEKAASALPQIGNTLDDYVNAAQSSYQSQDYGSALKYYNKAAQMSSSRAEVYLGRGLTYSQMGNNPAASKDFLTAAQVNSDREKYTKAAEAYSYYLQLNPNNESVRYQRGKTYLAAGDYQHAAEDISKFLESSPKSINALLDLGRAYYFTGDYKSSADAYQKAKKINSMDKRVYTGLAQAYMGMGDRKSCKSNYEKFKELATYVDRQKLADDPEWKKVLDFLQVKEE